MRRNTKRKWSLLLVMTMIGTLLCGNMASAAEDEDWNLLAAGKRMYVEAGQQVTLTAEVPEEYREAFQSFGHWLALNKRKPSILLGWTDLGLDEEKLGEMTISFIMPDVSSYDYLDVDYCIFIDTVSGNAVRWGKQPIDTSYLKPSPDKGDEDTSSGDEDTSSGDEDTSSGDEDTSSGDEDTSSGDKDTSSGDEDTSSGDKDISSGDEDTSSGDKDISSGDKDSSSDNKDTTSSGNTENTGTHNIQKNGKVRLSDGSMMASSADMFYNAEGIAGAVPTGTEDAISAAAGISEEDRKNGVNVKFYFGDVYKSAVKEALKNAAESVNGNLISMIDMDLYTIGKDGIDVVRFPKEPVEIVIGIPKEYLSEGRQYSLVCIMNGEVIEVPDNDLDSETITIKAQYLGAYALIWK